MISPGAISPGAPLAAFKTVVGTGVAPAATVKVTARVCGELPAPVEETVTVPLYVPVARPAGFTPTDRLPGLVPLAGVTLSQLPEFPLVEATAVNGRFPELDATCT